jgi:hypothetical protein
MKMVYLLPVLLLVSCTKTEKVQRSFASQFPDLPPVELGEVWDAKTENDARKILDATLAMLIKASQGDSYIKRDAHPKAHGCVKAHFEVDNINLPWDDRVGLFKNTKKYEAWIRFSNGTQDGTGKHDLEKDVRGMAIKVMNVDGTPNGVHDILLANNKEFFSKDGSDYMDLITTITRGSNLGIARYAIMHPLSAKRIIEAQIQTGNVLKQDYHSSVPYKLGKNYSARYRAIPCKDDKDSIPEKATKDYLQERLVSSLAKEDFCFNFYVQPNKNPYVQKVEDPRIPWDDATSKPIKVATIRIPKQTGITDTKRINFCENIQFNPWSSHPENRPLGQINRIRSLVYEEISRYRHERNRTPRMEPINHDPCSYKTLNLCDGPAPY